MTSYIHSNLSSSVVKLADTVHDHDDLEPIQNAGSAFPWTWPLTAAQAHLLRCNINRRTFDQVMAPALEATGSDGAFWLTENWFAYKAAAQFISRAYADDIVQRTEMLACIDPRVDAGSLPAALLSARELLQHGAPVWRAWVRADDANFPDDADIALNDPRARSIDEVTTLLRPLVGLYLMSRPAQCRRMTETLIVLCIDSVLARMANEFDGPWRGEVLSAVREEVRHGHYDSQALSGVLVGLAVHHQVLVPTVVHGLLRLHG